MQPPVNSKSYINVNHFLSKAPPPPRKTRAEMMKFIDADYYGYRDEDDGVLVPLENEHEKNSKIHVAG